jgi:hypothetical protein
MTHQLGPRVDVARRKRCLFHRGDGFGGLVLKLVDEMWHSILLVREALRVL